MNYYYKKYLKYKKKCLLFQMGGVIIEYNGKKYSGAGIILYEKYHNNSKTNPRNEWAVTLFKNTYRKMFEDLGGEIDKGEVPWKTAIREAREESLGIVNFTGHELTRYIDWPTNPADPNSDYYRTYFVEEHYSKRAFVERFKKAEQNKEKIEMNDVTRFYLNDLRAIVKNRGDIEVYDVDGNRHFIFGRTKAAIREFFKLT